MLVVVLVGAKQSQAVYATSQQNCRAIFLSIPPLYIYRVNPSLDTTVFCMLLRGFRANTDRPPLYLFCNESLLGSKYDGANE